MDIWQQFIYTLDSTVHRSHYVNRILSAQQYQECWSTWSSADINLLSTTLEQLYVSRGQIRINTLAHHCNLSVRQLERRFKLLIGVSPKVFARIIRFEAFRNTLLQDSQICIADAAADFGYQDQAHLTHEFKTWSGFTPHMFINQHHKRCEAGYYWPDPRKHNNYLHTVQKGSFHA